MTVHSCQGCGRVTESQLCCPQCSEFGRQSFFCSQDCFTANWTTHQPMHAILAKNKQVALKEELEKKHTITSLALKSIKHIVKSAQHKPKTEDEEAPLSEEALSPLGDGRTVGRMCMVVAAFCLFVFLISSRGQQVQQGADGETLIALQATVNTLKEKVEAHEMTIATLRRDLTSGLREVQRTDD